MLLFSFNLAAFTANDIDAEMQILKYNDNLLGEYVDIIKKMTDSYMLIITSNKSKSKVSFLHIWPIHST